MKPGNPGRMSVLRKMAETVVSVAVIVMFAGLLAVPEADDATRADLGFLGEQPA